MAGQSISPEERNALYDKLVASYPAAERKGDTMPCTSLNGSECLSMTLFYRPNKTL
jgi:hypothetical protein